MNTHDTGDKHSYTQYVSEDLLLPSTSTHLQHDQTYHSISTLYTDDDPQHSEVIQNAQHRLNHIFSQCMDVLTTVHDLTNPTNTTANSTSSNLDISHLPTPQKRNENSNATEIDENDDENGDEESDEVSRFMLKRAKSEFVAAGSKFEEAGVAAVQPGRGGKRFSLARCRNHSAPTFPFPDPNQEPVSLKLLSAEEMFRLGLVPTTVSNAETPRAASPLVFHMQDWQEHDKNDENDENDANRAGEVDKDDGLLRLRVTESQLEELEVDLFEVMAEGRGEETSSYTGSDQDPDDAHPQTLTLTHPGEVERGSPRSEVEDNMTSGSITPPGAGAKVVHSPQSLVSEVSAQEWARAVRVNEEILGYDSFSLPIIYEFRRTGFEETVELRLHEKMLIAGRYEVRETIGEAMFSIALKCFDTKEEQDVCVKVIKNDKSYFDQSLDEIKILQYVKAMGDPDEHHVVKLYDFFYHKEHLFIVTELLQEDLYGVYTTSLESGDNYFSISRLKLVAKHILKALVYIHSLGLIHCDIKPENIMMSSKERCEVKVIDLGSSCFLTDKLTLYIQSRYYRAPEVIIGRKYDQKIDIWSLGCVLAELYTGEVLFQENNAQTLLARMIALCGSFPRHMLVQGVHSSKVFVGKDFTLFERQEDGDVELLYPRRASLTRRLNYCKDEKFVDFIRSMLVLDPDQRPSADMCLQHAFLRPATD